MHANHDRSEFEFDVQPEGPDVDSFVVYERCGYLDVHVLSYERGGAICVAVFPSWPGGQPFYFVPTESLEGFSSEEVMKMGVRMFREKA